MKCNKCNSEWASASRHSLIKCPFCRNILVLPRDGEECVPHDILHEIVDVFGKEIIKENRLSGIIGDLMFDNPKLVQIFKFAITKQLGVKLFLLTNLDHSERSIQIAKIKYSFHEDNSLEKDMAYYVVDSFVYALDWMDEVPKMSNSIQKEEHIQTKIKDISIEYPEIVTANPINSSFWKIGFLICITLMLIGVSSYFLIPTLLHPTGLSKEVVTYDYKTIIPGFYSVRQKLNNEVSEVTMTAEIRYSSEDKYEIAVISEYAPILYEFSIGSDQSVTSEKLGTGNIRYNNILDNVVLTFNKNNYTWEFIK